MFQVSLGQLELGIARVCFRFHFPRIFYFGDGKLLAATPNYNFGLVPADSFSLKFTQCVLLSLQAFTEFIETKFTSFRIMPRTLKSLFTGKKTVEAKYLSFPVQYR